MKKIYISAIAMTAAAVCTASSAFAALSSVTAQTEYASISYAYDAGEDKVNKENASKLFDDFKKPDTPIKLTVTSDSASGDVMEVFLRLTVGDGQDYTVLDNYDFKITDSSNTVIYDSDVSEKAKEGDTSKEISLAVINKIYTEETKDFTIVYKLDENAASSDAPTVELASRIYKDKVVYDSAVPTAIPTAVPTAEPTPVPALNLSTPAPEATEAPTAEAPQETEVPEKKEKLIVCGTDIEPGRYIVSGNAKVTLLDESGNKVGEATVTDGKTDGVEGVKRFAINLSKGDIVKLEPIADGVKASVDFQKTNTTAVSSDGTPAISSKSNPKTGDNTTVNAMIALMAASALSAAGLEVFKRKRFNK